MKGNVSKSQGDALELGEIHAIVNELGRKTNTAQVSAESAQTTADNAAEAAANTAQTAADNAQTAADNAQSTADSARNEYYYGRADITPTDSSNFTYTTDDNGLVTITGYKGSDTNVVIPYEINENKVTHISSVAFHGCDILKSITIPNSVTDIDEYTFENCKNLTSIIIPDSVTKIGGYTFLSCTSLKSITIPDSVTYIDNYAFSGCKSLDNIILPDKIKNIYAYTFTSCESLESITIPNGVRSIGSYAFSGCKSLKSITIPDSVTAIHDMTFRGCYSLIYVMIPSSVTSISNTAFLELTNLTIVCEKNSYAEQYAVDNNIPYSYYDNMDIDHVHQNKNALNEITAEKVAEWDLAVEQVQTKADKEDKYGGFTGGHSSQNSGRGVAVGYNAHAYGGVAIGDEATAQSGKGIAIGIHSNTGAAIAIGDYAAAMLAKGMQFGKGRNYEEGTVQFWDWQLFNADGNIPLERLTLLFDKVMESMESLAEISGDYVIEPVVEGVTEKFTLTSSWTMLKYSTTFLTKEISLDVKYRLFAGDTGLTDSIIDDSVPTVTAAGGFEGDNITIVIYSHTTELFRAKLKTVSIGNKKVGKLIRI